MPNDLSELLAIGIPAVVIGLLVLAMLVQRELGPFAGLDAAGKWMLTFALGMGVFAFSLKLAVAALIEQTPPQAMARVGHNVFVPASAPAPDNASFANPAPPRPARYVWEGLPDRAPEPADNPGNPAKIALGKRLFNDTRLSADGTLSCASCHRLHDAAGADGKATAEGIDGQRGPRNSPTVWNAAFQSEFFWDGRAPSLEAQAQGPILNPLEMGMPDASEAERRIAADPTYRNLFERAFGDRRQITFQRIAQAIAAYERTLIANDTPYDRFVHGDAGALNASQLRGMALFESVGCVLCHRGPNFSDASLLGGESPRRFFPANATPYDARYRLLDERGERASWRIPSLRNVALTGPWLHNGSVDRLDEVVRIMAAAQLGRSGAFQGWLRPNGSLGEADRSPLSDRDVADLVAFLEALSSDRLRDAARLARH